MSRRLARAVSVWDVREIARRRLPRRIFDFIEGGAEDERTLAANIAAYRRVEFRPRVLRDVGTSDPSTSLLGREMALPLVLGPVGATRVASPEGELAVARSAARAGIPFTLSVVGSRSIEEVAAVSNASLWFQLYVWRDRGLTQELVDRAHAAGFEALVLTVDTAAYGKRERDLRNRFQPPPKIGLATIADAALRPSWTLDFIRSGPIRLANFTARGGRADPSTIVYSQWGASPSWADLEWLRSVWSGPIVVKGIQTVADAKIAADAGVECVALSNHGGRQLDDAPAPLDLVAPVADAVGDRTELICDGGVRRGSDIVKAIARGARACMSGRAYLYGLGAAGERGVDHVIELLGADMRRTMTLIGASTINDLTRDLVG
jgi:L-lactate dehydrogenase (cytochrome)